MNRSCVNMKLPRVTCQPAKKKKKKFRAARVPELLEKLTQNQQFQFHISGAAGRGNRCTLVLSQRRVIFMKPSGGAAQTVTHV